jgi:hypothetical protein
MTRRRARWLDGSPSCSRARYWGRERTTEEYATLLARSGLRLAQTISSGRGEEAMGHHLIEAQPV